VSRLRSSEGQVFAEERHRAILDRLRDAGKVKVDELAATFRVSAPTVRSDLARLEEQGLLQRTHGGAISASPTLFEPVYSQRLVMRHAEKRAIARAAADMVQDGETILLDAGTTTFEIALLLKERAALTVVTNSIPVAAALMESPGIQVTLVGGKVQPRRLAILGPPAVRFLEAFHVDRAFVAFNGVHAVTGFTAVDFDAAEMKRKMMECASETVVVADASKIGKVAFAVAAPLSEARLLITDQSVSEEQRTALEAAGLRVKTT
jgi:DeoR/GlpR family transcriptional regulator of sugar metabolism